MVLLQRIVEEHGEPPLVASAGNGGENLDALVGWCRGLDVILLLNLPRTSQDNPWVEHGSDELKASTGLGRA